MLTRLFILTLLSLPFFHSTAIAEGAQERILSCYVFESRDGYEGKNLLEMRVPLVIKTASNLRLDTEKSILVHYYGKNLEPIPTVESAQFFPTLNITEMIDRNGKPVSDRFSISIGLIAQENSDSGHNHGAEQEHEDEFEDRVPMRIDFENRDLQDMLNRSRLYVPVSLVRWAPLDSKSVEDTNVINGPGVCALL